MVRIIVLYFPAREEWQKVTKSMIVINDTTSSPGKEESTRDQVVVDERTGWKRREEVGGVPVEDMEEETTMAEITTGMDMEEEIDILQQEEIRVHQPRG